MVRVAHVLHERERPGREDHLNRGVAELRRGPHRGDNVEREARARARAHDQDGGTEQAVLAEDLEKQAAEVHPLGFYFFFPFYPPLFSQQGIRKDKTFSAHLFFSSKSFFKRAFVTSKNVVFIFIFCMFSLFLLILPRFYYVLSVREPQNYVFPLVFQHFCCFG